MKIETVLSDGRDCGHSGLLGWSPIYNTPAFGNFIQAAVGGRPLVLTASSGGQTVGLFRFFKYEHPKYGVVINSQPWFGSYGGCAIAADLPEPAADLVRRELLDSFTCILRQCPNLISSAVSLSPFEYRHLSVYHDILRPTCVEERNCQILRLPPDDADIEKNIISAMKSQRNTVRKSLRQGFCRLQGDSDEAWEFLYKTHVENIRAIGGRPKQPEHFKALRRELSGPFLRLSVAALEGRMAAALLCLSCGPVVEYIMPAIDAAYRSTQPLSFLLIMQMIDAVKDGARFWNFGGTLPGQKTLHHFKASWGALDYPYGYVINANLERLRWVADEGGLSEAAPYYYIYPFEKLGITSSPGQGRRVS